jgi:hypothetical protein
MSKAESSSDRLDSEMRVTFDVEELTTFFDGFTEMDAAALFGPIADDGDQCQGADADTDPDSLSEAA